MSESLRSTKISLFRSRATQVVLAPLQELSGLLCAVCEICVESTLASPVQKDDQSSEVIRIFYRIETLSPQGGRQRMTLRFKGFEAGGADKAWPSLPCE